ncbi:MAG: SsrA-binding protein SmpB [Candidatus Berkelbacteria bacterium]|nr:SsrA-binding protein SmpB [Candidatus Berkelbacteria bacterium]
MKIITVNKKAYHDYQVLETYETGVVLTGKEVRAIRNGRVNLKATFARIFNDELWLLNAHISTDDPVRTRKLLVKKEELKRLIGKIQEKNLTLIPLKMYFKNNRVKIELGLCQGLRSYDKREKIKKRDVEREIRQKGPY